MKEDLIKELADKAAELLFSTSTVPGDTDEVESRTEESKEDNVDFHEGVREKEGPEGFRNPTVVLLVGSRVHQGLVIHALGNKEDGEGPHGHLDQHVLSKPV